MLCFATKAGGFSSLRNYLTGVRDSIRFVLHIDVDPNRSGQTKKVNKKDCQYSDEQSKTNHRTPIEYPMKEHHKQDAEEGGENIGDKHSPVVKPGLWKEILVARVTAFLHVKWLLEGETARIE